MTLQTPQVLSEGAWALAWRRFQSDRVGVWSAITVVLSLALVLTTLFGTLWLQIGKKKSRSAMRHPSWVLRTRRPSAEGVAGVQAVVLYEPSPS
jgi:hypothetical protein